MVKKSLRDYFLAGGSGGVPIENMARLQHWHQRLSTGKSMGFGIAIALNLGINGAVFWGIMMLVELMLMLRW